MAFVNRLDYVRNTPPGRFYIHEEGLDVFGEGKPMNVALEEARRYLEVVLKAEAHKEVLKPYDFLLGTIWGKVAPNIVESQKVVDVFGFTDMNMRPGNPGVIAFRFRNGLLSRMDELLTFGDTLIMLGREEELRRSSSNLIEYFGRTAEGVPMRQLS